MKRATLIQIIGAAVASVGVGLERLSLGLIVAGAFAVVFGVAAERG